jgi:hypothetical protein
MYSNYSNMATRTTRTSTTTTTRTITRRIAISTRRRLARARTEQNNEEDTMMRMKMSDDENEESSVATTMGVKADTNGLFVLRPPCDLESVNGSVSGNSLLLPRPLVAAAAAAAVTDATVAAQDDNYGDYLMENNDDDVSILTEHSIMDEEEDDNISQATHNTSWTVITTGTDSTTIPTRNFTSSYGQNNKKMPPRKKGKRNLTKDAILLSNSQFKRRRMT